MITTLCHSYHLSPFNHRVIRTSSSFITIRLDSAENLKMFDHKPAASSTIVVEIDIKLHEFMNLYTAGVGLFETHVTWEDLEEILQSQLNTKAVFGPKKTLENIGEGKGFLSRMCLIRPDWQNEKEGENLPKAFVAKISSLMSIVNMNATPDQTGKKYTLSEEFYKLFEKQTKRLHNSECNVYEHMSKLPDGLIPRVKVVYFIQKFTDVNESKGVILMEYVPEVHDVPLYVNLDVEDLKKPLQAAAKWSATSISYTEEEKNAFTTKPFQELFAAMFSEQSTGNLLGRLRDFTETRFDKQIEKLTQIIKEVKDFEWIDSISDQLGMTRLLCHGDLWSPNVLWKKVNGELKVESLIDFQTSHFGCPAFDICRHLTTGAHGQVRRDHFEELVKYYYDTLMEQIKEESAPFTYEQLLESCKRYIPVTAMMVIILVPSIYRQLFAKSKDEQLMAKAKEELLIKVDYLLEDLFEYHERNMNIKQQTKSKQ